MLTLSTSSHSTHPHILTLQTPSTLHTPSHQTFPSPGTEALTGSHISHSTFRTPDTLTLYTPSHSTLHTLTFHTPHPHTLHTLTLHTPSHPHTRPFLLLALRKTGSHISHSTLHTLTLYTPSHSTHPHTLTPDLSFSCTHKDVHNVRLV